MGASEQFKDSDIKHQLSLILSSAAFKNSRVLSGFLEFVINETLAGRDQEIKEYSIAIHVLSRQPDFNPQLDAIVRIHAGRLRRALKEYYFEKGKKDPIKVEIPIGSYIPLFQLQEGLQDQTIASITETTSSKPLVAVLPFRNISGDASRDYFADGLGEQLSTELALFHDLRVISYYSSRHVAGLTSDIRKAASLLDAKYLLTGSVQNDDTHIRVGVQLIKGDNGEQLWTKSFAKNNTASGLFEIQNEIVRDVLTAIGGYYGAIFRDVLKAPHSSRSNGIEIYDAIFLYYHYQKVFSKEVLEKTIHALEAAVEADPDYALAWAMLGELYLDDKVMEVKQISNPLEQGLQCAMRAISIDPNCQHGYISLGWVYLFHHRRDDCLKAVDQCLAINPHATMMVGASGFVLVCAGEFEHGIELLNDSIQHNPYCPWWFYLGFVYYSLYKKEYLDALHWAEKVSTPGLIWDPMMKAASLGHLNRTKEAGQQLSQLLQLVPDAANSVKDIIGSFLLSQDLNNEILEGLRKAGLNKKRQPTGQSGA